MSGWASQKPRQRGAGSVGFIRGFVGLRYRRQEKRLFSWSHVPAKDLLESKQDFLVGEVFLQGKHGCSVCAFQRRHSPLAFRQWCAVETYAAQAVCGAGARTSRPTTRECRTFIAGGATAK